MRYRDIYKPAWVLPMLLGVIIFSSACSDEDYLANESRAVTFIPTHAAPESGTTRVNAEDKWTGNETFGICMYSGTSLTTSDTFNNYLPRKTGITYPTTSGITLDPATTDDTFYFPSNGDGRKFIAFGPVKTPTNSRVTYSLSTQNTEAAMEKADFIYSAPTKSYTKDDASVNLEFKHKLSRIVINVTNGDTKNTNFSALKDLKLKNMHTSVTMDLKDGSQYTESGTGTITPYRTLPKSTETISNTTENVTFQAIVATKATRSTAVIDFGGITEYKIDGHTFTAGESYVFDFVLKGKDVTLTNTKVIPWTGGTVAWNWKYYLQVGEKELNLYKEKSTGTIEVRTDYETRMITPSADVNWIGFTTYPGVGENHSFQYEVEENKTGAPRTGKITITAGELSVEVEVTQSSQETPAEINWGNIVNGGDANCFVLPTNTPLIFSVDRALRFSEEIDSSHPSLSLDEEFEIDIIWDDNEVIRTALRLSKGPNGQIAVISTGREGNALIGIRKPHTRDTYLWSWHIWVTDYKFEDGFDIRIHQPHTRKLTYMNVNLGATSNTPYGMFYVPGRKDPFPNLSYITKHAVVQPLTLTQTIQDPRAAHSNYLGGGAYDDFDMDALLPLRVFLNPCPKGWDLLGDVGESRPTHPFTGCGTGAGQYTYDLYTSEGTYLSVSPRRMIQCHARGWMETIDMDDLYYITGYTRYTKNDKGEVTSFGGVCQAKPQFISGNLTGLWTDLKIGDSKYVIGEENTKMYQGRCMKGGL